MFMFNSHLFDWFGFNFDPFTWEYNFSFALYSVIFLEYSPTKNNFDIPLVDLTEDKDKKEKSYVKTKNEEKI